MGFCGIILLKDGETTNKNINLYEKCIQTKYSKTNFKNQF